MKKVFFKIKFFKLKIHFESITFTGGNKASQNSNNSHLEYFKFTTALISFVNIILKLYEIGMYALMKY